MSLAPPRARLPRGTKLWPPSWLTNMLLALSYV